LLSFNFPAMLHEIHIQNYAVIDKLELEFHGGLNVLSGETGSGKSILVDALGLALGERASADVIRTGEDRAVVTAIFRPGEGGLAISPWKNWCDELGLAGGGDGELMLRREIQANGKSRILANDQPVTLAAVKNLAAMLVEIHGQSEHVQLLGREAQLALLDQSAGASSLLEKVGELFARRRELERLVEELSQNEQDRLRKMDLLSFQVRELEQAKLQAGEDARLEEEKTLLANLEKVRAAAGNAFQLLYEDEGSASARVSAASRALEDLARYDPSFAAHAEPLVSARATIDDLAITLRDYLGKLNAQPHRLEEVEDRLALLDRLKRKYGKTIEEVMEFVQSTRRQLQDIEHADERRAEAERELEKAAAAYRKAARELSEKRREAAQKMARLVREELAQVGMEKTRLEIHFETLPDDRATSHGTDEIEYRISPNPGEDLRPLEKIASGGELSRLMLALKTVAAGSSAGVTRRVAPANRVAPTFVFDEIDAGIGGRVAESVGQRLRRLARHTQVLCVTHLAQIACFADHHYFVEKFERAGRTVTSVKPLPGGDARAAELARMLSGSRITDAALKHAQAMLKQAAAEK
jgi:DNA repair protein RecN (Recombination protein N)